jgi:hypothetical protein
LKRHAFTNCDRLRGQGSMSRKSAITNSKNVKNNKLSIVT